MNEYLSEKLKVSEYNFYSLTTFSFFLFAFHEPVLTIIKKGLFHFKGKGELASISIYLLAPFLTIVISIISGYILKRTTPKFYGLITGKR